MRQSRSLSTRNRIIAAARELFLAQGLDGTSVAEVCRTAGVSNGALFHQFPTKEDLAFAVYTLVRRDFWNQIIAAMIEPEDPLDGVEAAVRASFAFQLDTRNNPDSRAVIGLVAGTAARDATGRVGLTTFRRCSLAFSAISADFRRTYPVAAHRSWKIRRSKL